MAVAIAATDRLSITQLSRREGVHTGTIWRWIIYGVRGVQLRATRLGGRRYIAESDWQSFCSKLNADLVDASFAPQKTGCEPETSHA